MIARQMVVKCRKCGRTFIRSMGGTQSMSKLFGLDAPPLCWKCEREQRKRNHLDAFTLGNIIKQMTGKNRRSRKTRSVRT